MKLKTVGLLSPENLNTIVRTARKSPNVTVERRSTSVRFKDSKGRDILWAMRGSQRVKGSWLVRAVPGFLVAADDATGVSL
jgi:hypothetical protein